MIIKIGTVVAGEYSGYTIIVDDDSEGETGGFYIYLKGEGGGFDYWFENVDHLNNQLSDFDVEWGVID